MTQSDHNASYFLPVNVKVRFPRWIRRRGGLMRLHLGGSRLNRIVTVGRLGASPEADPRDIGLLCNRCVSNCVSICPTYIRGAVYTRPTTTYRTMRECVARSGVRRVCCVALAERTRRVPLRSVCGTEHVSIRPHNGNITAI